MISCISYAAPGNPKGCFPGTVFAAPIKFQKEKASMKEVNEKLRDIREDHDISQRVIAAYLGVTQQTYSNYETGAREVPPDVVVRLSQFYKVSTDYLFSTDSGYTGNIDMRACYIGPVTLYDMIYNLLRLDKNSRQEVVDFIRFLQEDRKINELPF